MTRADVITALKQRLAEIERVLPPSCQRQAILAAYEVADALLRRLRDLPSEQRTRR